MLIKIGEKIKYLRKKDDVTQDKLAEYLGVTAQAISRWESEVCYPDIEILPSIASFFNITIDELMGYNISEKEQNVIIQKITELMIKGNSKEAISEARCGLALYPQNYAITLLLASQIFAQMGRDDTELADEVIALCQRILRDCMGGNDANDMLRLSAKNILINTLCKRERRDEANQIAVLMPSIVMGQEFIRQNVLKGEDRINYSLSVLPVIITMLNSLFLNNMKYANSEQSKPMYQYNTDECIRDIAIWDAVYKSISDTEKQSCWTYMFLHQRLARTLLDDGDKINALKRFKYAVDCIQYLDNNNSRFAYNLVQRSTVSDKDELCKKDKNNYNGMSNAYLLIHGYIENGYFTAIENEETFINQLETLRKFE